MVTNFALLSRSSKIAVAAVLAFAVSVPLVLINKAEAAQLQTRSVQLSNSATGATGVSYKATFNVATTGTVKGLIVDICARNTSPLLGTTCTIPGGFSWTSPVAADITTFTINGSAQTVSDTPTSAQWGVGTVETGRTLYLASVDGVAITAGQTVVVEVGGVTNPNDVDTVAGSNQVGSFYGRLATFANDTGANSPATYDDATTGESNLVDFGGVALSTTNNLTVTARVQEQLTFCVYVGAAATTCALASGSSANIPDATTPLSNSAVSINSGAQSTWFNVASNALNGVDVRMWSNNGNQGLLKSGAFFLDAFGGYNSGNPATGDDSACVADSASTSTEQFGMRIIEGAGVSPATNYNCAANNHGWDVVTSGGNDTTSVGSTYGDIIASTAAPNDETGSESQLEFAAKAALTTEAGVYQSVLNFIATGKY